MKLVLLIAAALILVFVSSMLGCVFLYLGWNHGVADVFAAHGLPQIGMGQAFFLALFMVTVGGLLKGVNAKVNS